MLNQILIEELELTSFIGVPEEERASAQRLVVSLILEPQLNFGALKDSICNAVDYAAVAEFVKAFSLARPRHLLETLADEIATALIDHFPLRSVEVELRKFILPNTAFVAVRIRRENIA